MKKMILAVAATLLVGISATAMAIDCVEVTTAVDVNSAYVWRGMTYNDGFVAQPSVNLSTSGFNLNVWGNLDMDDYSDQMDSWQVSETDFTLNYGFELGKVSTTVGLIEYWYPQADPNSARDTQEVYLSLGLPLGLGFTTTLDTYYDFDVMDEYYSKLGLSYGYDINKKTALTVGAAAGYAGDNYCGDDEAGFFDYSLSMKLGYAVSDNLSLSAGITYVNAIDDDNLVEGNTSGDIGREHLRRRRDDLHVLRIA